MASTTKGGALTLVAWLVLSGIGTTTYIWFTVRGYWAEHLASRLASPSLAIAISLEPRSATYHDLLCRNMIFASEQSAGAIAECRRSTELDPYNAAYWLDLAQAYYSAGKKSECAAALRLAIAVDPTTPDTAWAAANFLLILGDRQAALEQFAIALRGNPALAAPVLSTCWQAFHDLATIQAILPQNPDVYLHWLKLLLANGQSDGAAQAWSGLIHLKQPFDYHGALFYIDSLIDARAGDKALAAWRQLASRAPALQAYSSPRDLVQDSTFSQEILNSGFGWRYIPRPDIAIDLDTTQVHEGARSLSITFTRDGSDAGLSQYIAVQPNSDYQLSAWVKSERLESANGPLLSLSDASSNVVYASTQATLGDTPWHKVEATLRTGPTTTLLVLAISRTPGQTRIQGRLWIDDIRLVPA